VKRKEFIRFLIKNGCYLERHGKKHDLYLNPVTGKKSAVPRHSEIKDSLCRLIKNQLKIKE